MKILSKTLILLTLSIILASCSKENNDTQLSENAIINYTETKLESKSNKNSSIVIFSNIETADSDYNLLVDKVNFIIDAENKTATLTKDGEAGAFIYNLIEDEKGFLKFNGQKYSSRMKIPKWLCGVGCVLGGFAISMSDGPAPFADMYAIGFTYSCASNC